MNYWGVKELGQVEENDINMKWSEPRGGNLDCSAAGDSIFPQANGVKRMAGLQEAGVSSSGAALAVPLLPRHLGECPPGVHP